VRLEPPPQSCFSEGGRGHRRSARGPGHIRGPSRSAVPAAHCDWDSGHLRVRSKGGREQVLPMPAGGRSHPGFRHFHTTKTPKPTNNYDANWSSSAFGVAAAHVGINYIFVGAKLGRVYSLASALRLWCGCLDFCSEIRKPLSARSLTSEAVPKMRDVHIQCQRRGIFRTVGGRT
jgi:hypothetical protein